MTFDVVSAVWNLSRGIDYTHFLAAFIVLWFWRQPRWWWLSPQSSKKIRNVATKRTVGQSPIKAPTSETWTEAQEKYMSLVSDTDFEENVPGSTVQERVRFLMMHKGNKKKAIRGLTQYLEWVKTHETIAKELSSRLETTGDEDVDIWNRAAAVAATANGEKEPLTRLPQVARSFRMDGKVIRDLGGFRIIKVTPGMMEDSLAKLNTYSLAIALYLDAKLPRDSLDSITLALDARGGRGWRNLNGAQLLPFMKSTLQLLLSMFPERLEKAIVYPVPNAFRWIWTIVRSCLDANVASRVVLLTGTATIASPPPYDGMDDHMDRQVAEFIEAERLAAFKTDENNTPTLQAKN